MLFFQSSSLAPGLCLPCLGVRFSPALSVLLCFLFSFVWGLLGFAPQSLAVLFSVSSLLPFAPAVGLLLACVVCFAVLFVVLFWRPLRLGSAGVCPSFPGCSFLRPCCCLLLLPLVFFRASLLCVSSCSCFVCLCLLGVRFSPALFVWLCSVLFCSHTPGNHEVPLIWTVRSMAHCLF